MRCVIVTPLSFWDGRRPTSTILPSANSPSRCRTAPLSSMSVWCQWCVAGSRDGVAFFFAADFCAARGEAIRAARAIVASNRSLIGVLPLRRVSRPQYNRAAEKGSVMDPAESDSFRDFEEFWPFYVGQH